MNNDSLYSLKNGIGVREKHPLPRESEDEVSMTTSDLILMPTAVPLDLILCSSTNVTPEGRDTAHFMSSELILWLTSGMATNLARQKCSKNHHSGSR